MALHLSLHKRVLQFSFNARTSRGTMKDKTSWFLKVWDEGDPHCIGWGECGPLPGLSPELNPEFETQLTRAVLVLNQSKASTPKSSDLSALNQFIKDWLSATRVSSSSSLVFALETALLDLLNGGEKVIFKNSFVKGAPIPINGLIWMGGLDFMLQQIEIKIRDGFTCLKLKVGSHDFEKECDVLQYIRRKYFRDKITIRLDANGAFKKDDALLKLNQLARFDVHSIEQPLKPGMPELTELCRQSPIPIALDEELIGVTEFESKRQLLSKIKPQFVILKPSLHGGLNACHEWITLCDQLNIGWWITSALESSIGLNAIAQFTAQYPVSIPQGLGTGMIYENNIESPLSVNSGSLTYSKGIDWADLSLESVIS